MTFILQNIKWNKVCVKEEKQEVHVLEEEPIQDSFYDPYPGDFKAVEELDDELDTMLIKWRCQQVKRSKNEQDLAKRSRKINKLEAENELYSLHLLRMKKNGQKRAREAQR